MTIEQYALAMDLAKRVIASRERLGLSQTELAGLAGVSKALVCRVELGASNLNVDSLIKLCQALGVSSDYLLGRKRLSSPCDVELDPIIGKLVSTFSELTARERVFALDFLSFLRVKHEEGKAARREQYRDSVETASESRI